MTKAFDDWVAGLNAPVNGALHVAFQLSQVEGDHHRAWAIDQMVRILTGEHYGEWVALYCDGEYGPKTYKWHEGIAP